MPNHIGFKIKKIRDRKNLSQKRFAVKIGISEKTVSAYETGKITPSLKVLEKITEVYNVGILDTPSMKRSIVENKIAELENVLGELKLQLEIQNKNH